ncbi:MAG TPA: septal ring lytic transglycosylase RlpA family protein, partial [Solirubrobacteraceae bacterium]
LAGSSGVIAYGRRTACGQIIGPRTEGVAHPVLPCGVKLYLTYDGRRVLTRVIDRGPTVPGRQFEVTEALDRRLGLVGVQRIVWSYAGTR